MSPDAQRIAIAEACGWEFESSHDDWTGNAVPDRWRDPEMELHYGDMPIPDFLNDLNAMHEAEGTLSSEEIRLAYAKALIGLMPRLLGNHYAAYSLIRAAAAQRAEAFLKTLGLWKEGE